MILNQLIATFRGQYLSRNNDRASAEETETPADGTKDPGIVEVPAREEPVFVIVEVCLAQPVSMNLSARLGGPTTMDMLAACKSTERMMSRLSILHPFSRRRFPPERIIR
jgi:hypothetical protein